MPALARGPLLALLGSAVAAAATAPVALAAPSYHTARSTKDFVDSVGVNTHLTHYRSSYGEVARVKAGLQQLGIRNVRDEFCVRCDNHHRVLKDLGSAGIRFNLVMGNPRNLDGDPEQLVGALAEVPGLVTSVQGANEWDLHGGANWVNDLRGHQTRLYRAMKANPATRRLPVNGPTFGGVVDRGNAMGDLSAVLDRTATPNYPGGFTPEERLDRELDMARRNGPGKPVISSETGYHNGMDTRDTHPPTSERAAGVYVPRILLEQFRRGMPATYLYELVDYGWEAGLGSRDKHFGLLRSDWSEKPAGRSVRQLLEVIGDSGEAFTPGGLSYELTGDTAGVRHLLLQRADRTRFLVLWNDARVWDREREVELPSPTRAVTVNLAETRNRIDVLDVVRGTSPVATHTATNRVAVGVPAQPIVLRISDATTTPAPAAPAPTPRTSTHTGLKGEYFDDMALQQRKFVRTDPVINGQWQRSAPPGLGVDTFSVRYTGTITPRHSEIHRFYATTDDGVRVWIDGKLVVDRWRPQPATTHTGEAPLTAGRAHSIKVEYFERTNEAVSRLEWASAHQARELVPTSALRPAP